LDNEGTARRIRAHGNIRIGPVRISYSEPYESVEELREYESWLEEELESVRRRINRLEQHGEK
jgi:vacuolar-type H+-ATPase subunit D/Vma8